MAMKFGIGIFFGVTEFGPGIFWVQPRSHAFFFGVCVGGGRWGVGLIFPPFDHPCHLKFRSTSPGDGSPRCDIKQ